MVAAGAPARAAALVGGLAAAVWVRAIAVRALEPDGLLTGFLFGATLLGLTALAAGHATAATRRVHPSVSELVLGVAGGAVLVGVALAVRDSGARLSPGHAAPFVPWVAGTVLVATAEEALLRGALFEAVGTWLGLPAALLVTCVAFAAMHVPSYGPAVVPLDLAVGLALGGLRLVTGGIGAPTLAHAVADLATWWL